MNEVGSFSNATLLGIPLDTRLIIYGKMSLDKLARIREVCKAFKLEIEQNAKRILGPDWVFPDISCKITWIPSNIFCCYDCCPKSAQYRFIPSSDKIEDWKNQVARGARISRLKKLLIIKFEAPAIFQSNNHQFLTCITKDSEGGYYALLIPKNDECNQRIYGIRNGQWSLVYAHSTTRHTCHLVEDTHFAVFCCFDSYELKIVNLQNSQTLFELKSEEPMHFKGNGSTETAEYFILKQHVVHFTTTDRKKARGKKIHTYWNFEKCQSFQLPISEANSYVSVASFYSKGSITLLWMECKKEDTDTTSYELIRLDWNTLTLTHECHKKLMSILDIDRYLENFDNKLRLFDKGGKELFSHTFIVNSPKSPKPLYCYNEAFRFLFIGDGSTIRCINHEGVELDSIVCPDGGCKTILFWEYRAAIFFFHGINNGKSRYSCVLLDMRDLNRNKIVLENLGAADSQALTNSRAENGILLATYHPPGLGKEVSKAIFYNLTDMSIISELSFPSSSLIDVNQKVYLTGGLVVNTYSGSEKTKDKEDEFVDLSRTNLYHLNAPVFPIAQTITDVKTP